MSKEVLESLGKNLNRDMVADLFHNGFYWKHFDFLVKHMQKEEKHTSWRSAWVVVHLMKEDDPKIKKHLTKIIKSIESKADGHQRELLKIVRKMKLSEKNDGLFFDVCINIWESVNKKPATRYYAGLFIIEMAKKYPEIKNELEHLTSYYYTQTLSPGIKRSFDRRLSKINQ
ncbi:MAG: hypothetical protein H8E84_05930 [Flavobacteriales bacterium]|nr:hypothetical protein [Flavobacteriales bacterium]